MPLIEREKQRKGEKRKEGTKKSGKREGRKIEGSKRRWRKKIKECNPEITIPVEYLHTRI